MGPRYGEGITFLSELFSRMIEDSKRKADENMVLKGFLEDEKLLRRLWKQGVDIDWDRKDFDYRYLELPRGDLVVLICKMVGGGGQVMLTAGIFEQKIMMGGVDATGVTVDKKLEDFRHVGRFKDHRGCQGDVFWKLLIQSGENFSGSLLKKTHGHELKRIIDVIKDRVEQEVY